MIAQLPDVAACRHRASRDRGQQIVRNQTRLRRIVQPKVSIEAAIYWT